MSLESALEEERLEILKLLERPQGPSTGNQRHGSSNSSSPTLPRSPPLVPRTTSPSRGRSPGATNPPIREISSMILAAESSPPPQIKQNSRSRSRETSPSMLNPGPRLQSLTPNADYQFGNILPISTTGNVGTVRRTGAGPTGKPTQSGASPGTSPTLSHAHMSPAYQETLATIYDESGPFRPGGMGLPPGAGQHTSSVWGSSNKRSSSPYSQNRSASPGGRGLLSPLSPPPTQQSVPSGRHMLTSNDVVVDLDHAYRRLSDEALARSGGTLSQLPARGYQIGHIRANSGESVTRDGGVRLEKDLTFVGEDGREVAVESSDESAESSDDDSDIHRTKKEPAGRPASKFGIMGAQIDGLDRIRKPFQKGTSGSGAKSQPTRKTMSLLAAAEEERKSVSSRYQVSSLLTPSLMVSPPTVTQANTAKNYIHPNTNYDLRSHTSTPISSDAEDEAKDRIKARGMALTVSPIMSTPETNRTVRSIIRGDLEALKQDPAFLKRKQKSYLVATDLSSEAAHALEWTIGTVLRDGDTLLAIYAIDEEAAAETPTAEIADEGSSRKTSMSSKTVKAGSITPTASPSPENQHKRAKSLDASGTASPSRSSEHITATPPPAATTATTVDESTGEASRTRSKTEQERWQATESITALLTKLLRRTRLQINVVIEVIHCKSPKHLLTEMIDVLEPTLVILGSRGRGALKGVLLGSFSNYLVTKSSVPVMVARKKLKKTKYTTKNPRLTNNLGGGFENVRID